MVPHLALTPEQGLSRSVFRWKREPVGVRSYRLVARSSRNRESSRQRHRAIPPTKIFESSFSGLSPRPKIEVFATRISEKSNCSRSLGIGALVWEFNYIWLLVTLVNLNADAR